MPLCSSKSLPEDRHRANDREPGSAGLAHPAAKDVREQSAVPVPIATFPLVAGKARLSPDRVPQCAWASDFLPERQRRESDHSASTAKSCANSGVQNPAPLPSLPAEASKPSQRRHLLLLAESLPPKHKRLRFPKSHPRR